MVTKSSIGQHGTQLSKLIFGVWRLNDHGAATVSQTIELIETCLAVGISTFDHADIYGLYSCEETFGKALRERPDLRSRIELIGKCGIALVSPRRPQNFIKHYNTTYQHIKTATENSLKLLQTDVLELMLIHRPDPLMDPDGTARALDELVAEGKVKNVGVSNFNAWQMELLNSRLTHKIAVNQIEASVCHLTPFLDGTIGYCQQEKIVPLAWSPLAGGRLFSSAQPPYANVYRTLQELTKKYEGTSVAMLALAFLLRHPANIHPIIGSTQLPRIREQAAALNIVLDHQDWYAIWTACAGEVP